MWRAGHVVGPTRMAGPTKIPSSHQQPARRFQIHCRLERRRRGAVVPPPLRCKLVLGNANIASWSARWSSSRQLGGRRRRTGRTCRRVPLHSAVAKKLGSRPPRRAPSRAAGRHVRAERSEGKGCYKYYCLAVVVADRQLHHQDLAN
jgi:hypothetical protein